MNRLLGKYCIPFYSFFIKFCIHIFSLFIILILLNWPQTTNEIEMLKRAELIEVEFYSEATANNYKRSIFSDPDIYHYSSDFYAQPVALEKIQFRSIAPESRPDMDKIMKATSEHKLIFKKEISQSISKIQYKGSGAYYKNWYAHSGASNIRRARIILTEPFYTSGLPECRSEDAEIEEYVTKNFILQDELIEMENMLKIPRGIGCIILTTYLMIITNKSLMLIRQKYAIREVQ